MQSKTKTSNPFEGAKDQREVWNKLLAMSKPVDKKDFKDFVESKKSPQK